MNTFLLNPDDADLDLMNKDDRKLFQDASKGLTSKEEIFDGKKEKFSKFSKLLAKEFDNVRVAECLTIPTTWRATGSAAERRNPLESGMIDIFKIHKVDQPKVKEYADLVWSDATLGNTPKYFDFYETPPASTDELNRLRNKRRLKHIMLGNKLWNSLTTNFKLELAVNEAAFKINREYDGPLLWDHIRRRVNPTTTVGASRFKEQLETTTLSTFKGEIVKYNTWFQDTRDSIIKEEGDNRYDEYLRNLFHSYLTYKDQEFVDTIKFEKRKWSQGQQKDDYTFRDLLELGRLTYNNLVEDDSWEGDDKVTAKVDKNCCSAP